MPSMVAGELNTEWVSWGDEKIQNWISTRTPAAQPTAAPARSNRRRRRSFGSANR